MLPVKSSWRAVIAFVARKALLPQTRRSDSFISKEPVAMSMTNRVAGRPAILATCLIALLAAAGIGVRSQQLPLPAGAMTQNFQAVGYTDLNRRPGFKLAIQEVKGRWYVYIGAFWKRGWSVVDVTEPATPKVTWVEGPANTGTMQVDFAEGRMEVPLSKIPEGRDFDPSQPYEEGFLLFDTSDPLKPKKLGAWKTGGTGTHRNYYDGGRYVHAAAAMPGYKGQIYVIVDVSDPANPKEAGRWWVPGQHTAGGETLTEEGVSLHGPPVPVGNLVYLPYGGSLVILDISDVSKPMLVSRMPFSPPFLPGIGVHSVLPLPDRKIAITNSEAIAEYCKEPLYQASIVDISDPKKPFLVSMFPRPVPPPGLPYTDFCDKGGRFGPHNISQLPGKFTQRPGNIVFMTFFNAGVRAFDISDKRQPKEVGYFIPPDPTTRYGPLPASKLVIQTQDVLQDTRGYIYITDRNVGLWILKYTGPQPKSKNTQH